MVNAWNMKASSGSGEWPIRIVRSMMAHPMARPNELLAFGMGGGRDIAYLTEPPSASVDARRVWAPLMLLALVLMAPLGSGSTLPASSTVGDPTWNGVDAIDVFEDRDPRP